MRGDAHPQPGPGRAGALGQEHRDSARRELGQPVVVVARHTDQPHFSPVNYPYLRKNLSLKTSYGHPPPGQRWDRRRSLDLTLDYLARGRLRFAPMITHQFEWEELPDVYARMDAGEAEMIGVCINWT